ncbi:hypothetical protein SAMN02745121_07407 [Nannocystis exedens]|uniref:Uncharacterized protein n=1 Tax=Nannocystis exedens TaxID=54 RepID=A0A1I2GP60_9BACT|nr:hypothetical protein [Nannocystis exedens]PCC68711.1 hypothetical protein NAEX_01728 [Nannocystis exedens]SFF19023.1 hypothetical protein SAMN02745121_07407 [Nannocystis exedens]
MSRNFHNLHVHAPTERQRERVVRAVLAYAKKTGYERVARTRGADRVIRLGGRAPWLTIEDDGHEAGALADAVSTATKLPVLEAYCEASAIVWLGLLAEGKRAGGWGSGARRGPAKRLVAPLLAKGTPAELTKAFADGLIQIFPETALEVAAQRFGLPVAQMFGDRALRGTTLALRRKQPVWTPQYREGAPAFAIGWGSNRGWGCRHLVFVGQTCEHRVQIGSVGGPGRGLSIRLTGSAVEQGFVEVVSCSHEALKLVPAGPHTWVDARAAIPAGLVEAPDMFAMGRREASKAREIERRSEGWLAVVYRTLKEGECELVAEVTSGASRSTGELELMVMWQPWRPSATREHVDTHTLFLMHRREHVSAHVTLRGSLAEAWAWARPHVEAWSAAHEDEFLRVLRDDEVVLHERTEGSRPPFDRVAALFPGPTTPFQVKGGSYLFGTFGYAPWQMDPRDRLVVELVLAGADPECEHAEDLRRLEAICDEAIRAGVSTSALVEMHRYRPDDKTRWEHITVRDDGPLKLAAWHETHVRGVDRRLWMSADHAARLDRAALPDSFTVTELGGGIRLQMSDDRPRRELEPLVAALGSLVPSTPEVERWVAERAAPPASTA